MDIAFQTATALATMLRRREIGAVELLEHYLARVERFNPALNAIIATDLDAARRRAADADTALQAGEIWGPLHGLPMTVKESFDLAGLPSSWGSPGHRDSIPATNAVAVDRLLDAGAIVFGKTNVPIWLADAQSFNDVYGTTVNPWDAERTPGGSSGGAAAALAAGLTGLELGSDIASSIRNPAHYSGVFGHKPTWGICPPRGHGLGGAVAAVDINVVGPLARGVADLELALSLIAGPDTIDAAGWRLDLPAPRGSRLKDFRVAVVADHPTAPVSSEVRDLIERLAGFLDAEGVTVRRDHLPALDMDEVHRTFDIMLRAATSARQGDDDHEAARRQAEALGPDADDMVARMLRGVTMSHRDWLRMDERRQIMRWRWHDYFQDCDVLLCPVLSTAAFPHDHRPPYQRTLRIDNVERPFMSQLFWAGIAGLPYLPATATPIGFSPEGLPVGIQVVGPAFGDRSTLAFARLLEDAYQGFVPPPAFA